MLGCPPILHHNGEVKLENVSGMFSKYITLLIVTIGALTIKIFLYYLLFSPLASVPGPLVARFGRLYYFIRVANGRWELDNLALHEKYGPVVRVASNMYSIQSPELAKTPYAINSKFAKTDWYDAWRHPDLRKWTLFPERDLARHADTRKRFQSLYSMSSLVNYEPFVDECTALFSGQLTEYADRGEAIKMGHWFQCYAFGKSLLEPSVDAVMLTWCPP